MTTSAPTLIRDPWRRLWHFLTGDGFLAAIVILAAGLILLAMLLPQTPIDDPIAYSRWLSETQARFESLTNPLTTLGLFSVTSSFLFHFTLALLGLCCALRGIDQIDRLRQPDRTSRRSHGAALLVYSGALIVLLGLAVGSFVDYRVDNIIVEPGVPTTVPGTPYTLRLDAVENDRATIALLNQTETIAQGVIADRQPLQNNVTVYLDRVGPALNISAKRGPTQTLQLQSTANTPLQPAVFLAFTPDQNEGFVAAPDINIVLRLAPTGHDRYAAQIYQGATGKNLGSQALAPGDTINVEDAAFTFKPAAYLTVSLANQPSHWLIAVGWLVTTLGLCGSLIWPGEAVSSRRVVRWLVSVVWLVWTALLVAQLVMAYPHTASLRDASVSAVLAVWLLFSGSVITRRRARILLIVLGLIAAVTTALWLIALNK